MDSDREQRLLEIEAAKAQLAWLKAEIARTGETPALLKYLEDLKSEIATANRIR